MRYKVVSCGCTDPGRTRSNNEDVWFEEPELQIFAVADGMGGHRAGEVAAKEAIQSLFSFIKKNTVQNPLSKISVIDAKNLIERAIAHANGEIFRLGKSEEQYRGMGTTLCCIFFHPLGVITAHVGDSRIYRLNNKKLQQITHDHSLLRELLDLGQINERQAPEFLYRNIITRAVGTGAFVDPSFNIIEPIKGDLYLMCTDGLTDLVTLEEMETILNEASNIRNAVKLLVKTANDRGGFDNITVVLMLIQEEYEAPNLS